MLANSQLAVGVQGLPAEQEILMEFYDATNGPDWLDDAVNKWGSTRFDHCSWRHIDCDEEGWLRSKC